MDTRTGQIVTPEQIEAMRATMTDEAFAAATSHLVEMKTPPTLRQMSRRPPKVGRNEPCPCGSGEKFKKCCLGVAEL